jgi:hypothetical protein
MKVSQSGKNMQLQKPSGPMMKLALMRTTTGKEDPELPMLQRISSLELPVSVKHGGGVMVSGCFAGESL